MVIVVVAGILTSICGFRMHKKKKECFDDDGSWTRRRDSVSDDGLTAVPVSRLAC